MASTSESQSTAQMGVLTPVLSSRYALRMEHAAVCLVLALLFLVLSYLTLPTGALWNHVAAGDYMLTHRQLPQAVASMPLAEGLPTVSTSWLSELLLAAAYQAGGPAALSALFAVVTFASVVILARVFYLQTGRMRLLLGGLFVTLFLGWGVIGQLQPATFAFLCLATLLALLVRGAAWQTLESVDEPAPAPLPLAVWIGVPVLTAVWANLDASFVVALGLLLAWSVGTFCDVAIHRGVRSALQSPGCRQRIYVFELAIFATLLTPQGIDAWLAVLGLASASLGQGLAVVSPALTLASLPGVALASVCLLSAVLLRLSPRRVSVAESLIMVLGVAASAWQARWLPWFAPLAAVVLLPHLAATLRLSRRAEVEADLPVEGGEDAPPKTFQFAYTLICLLLVWIGFALSPLATPVLGGKPRSLAAMHHGQTPLAIAAWLKDRPAAPHLVYAPIDWADYLAFQAQAPIFAGAALEALPARARIEYLQFGSGENWETIADRYAVDLVVIDKSRQSGLLAAARRVAGGWQPAFEDSQALVLERVILPRPQAPAAGSPPAETAPSESPLDSSTLQSGSFPPSAGRNA